MKVEDKSRRLTRIGKSTRAPEEELVQLANLVVGGEKFALDIMLIKEIIRLPEITRVPQAPSYIEGFIPFRDMVIPLVNLARRLGLEGGKNNSQSLVVSVTLGAHVVGLLVERVCGVLRVPRAQVLSAPQVLWGKVPAYVSGVVRQDGELILVLDLGKILSGEEVEKIQGIGRRLGGVHETS